MLSRRARSLAALLALAPCWVSEASAEPAAPPAPEGAQAAPSPAPRRGAAVLAVGGDAAAHDACRALARAAYRSPALYAPLAEADARALCGALPDDPTAPPTDLVGLRAALTEPLDGVAQLALLEGIAARTRTAALVVVAADGASARVAHVDESTGTARVRLDPASVSLAPGPVPEGTVESLGRLVAPAAPAPPPPSPIAPAAPGPRRAPAPPPPPPPEESSLVESPFFWVAVGTVAALGLTVLIVSQATDVDRSQVQLSGTVLR